jgi:hypothetical protein
MDEKYNSLWLLLSKKLNAIQMLHLLPAKFDEMMRLAAKKFSWLHTRPIHLLYIAEVDTWKAFCKYTLNCVYLLLIEL